MKLINAKNIRSLSKSYANQIHGKRVLISHAYLQQINDLVEAVVKSNVAKQDNLKGTLQSTNWGNDCLVEADNRLEAHIDQ